ncbi:hypothetical protein ACGF5F_24600 [Streptomyces sp. NPDC047821]|uniref:P-loop NTPase n=1 Tax=Streptomyces sp. NPDC047821 TaxID=3365488 RepID=UPI00371FC8F1
MDASIHALLARLLAGPAMLLLGQHAADDEQSGSGPAMPDLLGSLDEDLVDVYRRFDTATKAGSVPVWLSEIAAYPWNGVFTSRIDSALPNVFSADWRRVVPTAQAQLGRHPRSTTELQLRYLFGGVALPEDERPPADVIQEVETRARAVETLNTLADTLITPRGVVVIEGYRDDDWLTPQELFTFVSRLQAGQAHMFSTPETLREDRFVRAAVDRGTLVLHHESFAAVLSELEAAGQLRPGMVDRGARNLRFIPVRDGFADVDVSTWNRIIGAARPIDAELLEPFTSASSALRYQRFRNFLGASEGTPPWKAVASGYNLRRDFEADLLRRVQASLDELAFPEPIVVAGQTATGKSVALCALAQDVARAGQAAVLHRSRRGDQPTIADIDAFAAWADEHHALPTLLVWDGMANVDEYYTLQRRLRSRGRRVLIVGSSYLSPANVKNIVRADAVLSGSEIARAKTWLTGFGVPVPSETAFAMDSSFLAFLYRVLPDTERGLRRGLTREMRAAESGLEALSQVATSSDRPRLGAVAQALEAAGFNIDELMPADHPHGDLASLSFEARSSAEQLTSMVLVAGRRGLRVPLELPLRILGREGSSRIVELVRNFDIFRWTESDSGSQYLGTRTRLEAELLAKEDLNVRTEVGVVVQLIENLRPETSRWGGEEVQFIVDLMDGMGPQSPDSSRYAQHYLDLAHAFRELRTTRNQAHPRLVLLEANLTREYVHWAQEHHEGSSEERLGLLRELQSLLEVTLEESDTTPRTRMHLLVELASADGAQVFELSRMGLEADAPRISALMDGVTRAALSARALDPENVYPVDVVAWTTKRAIESGVLPEEVRIDLLANAQASLDSIDPDTLSPPQRAVYNQRNVDISRLLNDQALETKHLSALMENGDPAAYYFLARRSSAGGDEGKRVAVQTLLEAPVDVRADWRCSRLLLDLFWELKTGRRFLRGERQTLAFTEADWSECIRVADLIPSAGDFDRYRLDFLRGLSLFHLGSYRASEEIFRILDEESQDLSSRVVSAYLASDAAGNARIFTGRVNWASQDGRRGAAWVDQLSIEVPFIPLRFSMSDFRKKGDVLPTFHIAFNMRGALADPIRAVQRVERRALGGQ